MVAFFLSIIIAAIWTLLIADFAANAIRGFTEHKYFKCGFYIALFIMSVLVLIKAGFGC